MPIAETGIDKTKRAKPKLTFQPVATTFTECRTFGLQRQYASTGIVTGCLHHVIGIANGHRHALYVVEREAADINLTGLRVADGQTVVTHGRMLCAEIAYTDRLHAPDAAVVTDVGTGKALDCFAQLMDSQTVDILTSHRLDGFRR